MSYRNNREPPRRMFRVAFPEKLANLKQVVFPLSIGIVVFFLLAFVFGNIYNNNFNCDSIETFSKSFIEAITVGVCLVFDFMPQANQLHEPDSLEYLARIVGFIYTCVFSGVIVATFMRPANIIAFSKYAVIDAKRNKLVLRYWIKKPENNYLFNVVANVEVSTPRQRNAGTNEEKRLFRYTDPNDYKKYPNGGYRMKRGVWYLSIPLWKQSENESTTLLEALNCFFESNEKVNPTIRITVSGISNDGLILTKYHDYTPREVLYGYRFVSIQGYEIFNADCKESRKLFYEHFNMVCKQKERDISEFYPKYKPLKKYELEPNSCKKSLLRRVYDLIDQKHINSKSS